MRDNFDKHESDSTGVDTLPLSLFDIHITNTNYLTNDQEKEEDNLFLSIEAHPKSSIAYRPPIPTLPNFPCPSKQI